MMTHRLMLAAAALLFAMSATQSYAAGPSSSYCKSLLASMGSKPKSRAMALSSDGQICSAFWGERAQPVADKKAMAGCQENGKRKCSIVKR